MVNHFVQRHPAFALLAWAVCVTGILVVFVSLVHFINPTSYMSPEHATFTSFEQQNRAIDTLNEQSKDSHWGGARFYWRFDHVIDGIELVMEGSPACTPTFLDDIPPEVRAFITHAGFTRFSCHYLSQHLQLWASPNQPEPLPPAPEAPQTP